MTTTLSSRAAAATPGAAPKLWALLFVLAGNMLIDALEVSVVLPALPAVADGLGLSLWGAQWVMSGFALGFAGLLFLGPRVTARWGRRRVYLVALAVFALASVAGGLADDGAPLIAARVVKGACAALTAPAGLAIIATVFPEGAARRRAVSVYSLFGAAGFTVGLLLAGGLTALGWRWPLLFPAPAAVLLLVCAWRLLPRDGERAPGAPGEGARPRTSPGEGARPRTSPGEGAPSRVRHERPPRPPLFKPALLLNGTLLRSALGAATLNGAYLGLLLTAVFALHEGPGWTPWQTALGFLPACVPLVCAALFAGRMAQWAGTGRLVAAGAGAALLGCGWQLAGPGPGTYVTGLLPSLALFGLAFVLAFGALNIQATTAVPERERALAVPLYQTGVQLGAALSLTGTAALLTGYADPRAAALFGTALAALGAAAALVGLSARRPVNAPGTREHP